MESLSSIGLGIIFAAGRDARTVGVPRTVNPIERGSPASSAWFAGWDEADTLVPETESAEFVGFVEFANGAIIVRGCIDFE
jgi:hypothetical protein